MSVLWYQEVCAFCRDGVEPDKAFVVEREYDLKDFWHRQCAADEGLVCPICFEVECDCESEETLEVAA